MRGGGRSDCDVVADREPTVDSSVGGPRGVASQRLDSHARVAPTGVAFGPPMSMIRHRFGGNLRAARAGVLRRRPSRTAARRSADSLRPSRPTGRPGRRRSGTARTARRRRRSGRRRRTRRPRSAGATRSTSVRGGDVHETAASVGGVRRRVARASCSPAAAQRQRAAGGGAPRAPSTIAIELPQQGSEKAASDPIINGIKLAVKQAGGAAGGYTIDIPQSAIYDDALNGAHDPQTGAQQHEQDRRGRDDGRASSARSTRASPRPRSRSRTRPACSSARRRTRTRT